MDSYHTKGEEKQGTGNEKGVMRRTKNSPRTQRAWIIVRSQRIERRHHGELIRNGHILIFIMTQNGCRVCQNDRIVWFSSVTPWGVQPPRRFVGGKIRDRQDKAPLADETISSNKIWQIMYCCLSPRHLIHRGCSPSSHNQFLLICQFSGSVRVLVISYFTHPQRLR